MQECAKLFYTYVWSDANGVPFYVGKGSGNRAYSTSQRSDGFKRVHKAGGCTVEIVDWFIHEAQAHALETELIARYGRRDRGGLLVNKTDGGDGFAGLIRTPEHNAKIGAAHLGKKHAPMSDEARANIGAAARGKKRSALTRERMSAAQRGRKKSSAQCAKNSEINRRSGPRARNSSGFKGVSFHTPSSRWRAKITTDGKQHTIGNFATPQDAAHAYDRAAYSAWGAGCYLNFPADLAVAI